MDQKLAFKIICQQTGPNKGKFFVTTRHPFRQDDNCLYLTVDGNLSFTCGNGWFQSVAEVGEALKKCHVRY